MYRPGGVIQAEIILRLVAQLGGDGSHAVWHIPGKGSALPAGQSYGARIGQVAVKADAQKPLLVAAAGVLYPGKELRAAFALSRRQGGNGQIFAVLADGDVNGLFRQGR